jgi:hypothetical protein
MEKDSHDAIAIENTHVKEESSAAYEDIDPVAERKLVRKLDWILLPMFCIICGSMHFLNRKQSFILCRLHELYRQVCFLGLGNMNTSHSKA